MRLSRLFLLFILCLFCYMIEALRQYGYEIRDLVETDEKLFEKEAVGWSICNLLDKRPHGENYHKKIENILPSQPILSVNDTLEKNTNDSEAHVYYIHKFLWATPPHKYISGSAKIWYLDDDFKSGSTITVEILLDTKVPEARELRKPCLTMNISQPQRQGGPNFEFLSFGDFHDSGDLEFIMKIQMHYSDLNVVKKPISFGLREVTLHLSNEFLNVTHPSSGECAANCDACFGLKPFQCVSCSPGSHWHGFGCTNCHGFCDKCTGPTEYECLGCNFDYFDYGNGLCLETCFYPFWYEESNSPRLCRSPCKPEEYIWNFTVTCLASCVAPLVSFTNRFGSLSCESPCPNDQNFLYMNGSCLSECSFPLETDIEHGVKFCRNPCNSTENFLYPDGFCREKCPAPMQIRIEKIAKYCENPCHSRSLYLFNNGSCSSSCPAPLVGEFRGGEKFCVNPCESTSDYLYYNRLCLKDCPAPLQIRTEPIAKYCVNPCHSNNFYLYQNGSCLPTCQFPRKMREEFGVKYCEPPCNVTREYILKDGSCSTECPFPLVRRMESSIGTSCLNPCESDDHLISLNNNGSFSCLLGCPDSFKIKTEHGLKYCMSPCLKNQYYFDQNRTCLDTCPYPLKIELGEGSKLCRNPCSKSNPFLYDDQSCHESCPMPFRIEERNYCKSPCGGGENEYLYLDGTCQEKCEYPYKILNQSSFKICQIDLSKSEAAQVDQMRELIKVSNILSEIGGFLSCLINSGDPISILALPLLGMFEKIKYTDVLLPIKTELILNPSGSAGKVTQLQNIFDESILRIGIICGITLLVWRLSRLAESRRGSKIFQMLQKCDFILRWNALVPIFMRINCDIFLYYLNEFENLPLTSPRGIAYILGMILTIFIVSKIFNLSRRREIDLPRWRFLFEVFSEGQKFFILISFARVILFQLIIGLLNDYPKFQAILMVLLSFGMCFYLIWLTPVKKVISKIQYLVIELALLFYNVIFGALAVFDLTDSSITSIFGQLLNILYITTSVLLAVIIVLKILHAVYSHYNPEDFSDGQGLSSRRNFEALGQTNESNNADPEEGEDSIEPSIAID